MQEKFTYQSTSGGQQITAYLSYPDSGVVRGVVQIVHGMCEYYRNYDEMIGFFNRHGFIVCGEDHLGHGETARGKTLGYFTPKNGYRYLAEDVFRLTDLMKKRYPYKPYFLYAHSMGSFIARYGVVRHQGKISGLILSGTCGKNPLIRIALAMAQKEAAVTPMEPSRKLYRLAFGRYNKRAKPHDNEMDWLSRDPQVGRGYLRDPLRHFVFTSAGFLDLFHLVDEINQEKWFGSFDKNLPVLVASGEEDPVGGYGRGVRQVYSRLRKQGVGDVTLALFAGNRHEPHTETDRKKAFDYYLHWMESRI